jgi:hypothetical protein
VKEVTTALRVSRTTAFRQDNREAPQERRDQVASRAPAWRRRGSGR